MATVSVIMPVHNAMPFLPMAVESILSQSFKDFELIIIDDFSTDETVGYLTALTDSRIRLIKNPVNSGICFSLQRGLELAVGKYIARLDGDDISSPDRLKTQVDFLETEESYGLIGSSIRTINERDEVLAVRTMTLDDVEIRWRMLFKNIFIHSTVMFRRSLIKEHNLNYEETYGEDYFLWNNLLRFTKAHILPQPLVDYRVHSKSWTIQKKEMQERAAVEGAIAGIGRYIEKDNNFDLRSFVFWSRGKITVPGFIEYQFAQTFIELLKSFCKHNNIPVGSTFWKNKLRVLRKRATWFTFLKLKVGLLFSL